MLQPDCVVCRLIQRTRRYPVVRGPGSNPVIAHNEYRKTICIVTSTGLLVYQLPCRQSTTLKPCEWAQARRGGWIPPPQERGLGRPCHCGLFPTSKIPLMSGLVEKGVSEDPADCA